MGIWVLGPFRLSGFFEAFGTQASIVTCGNYDGVHFECIMMHRGRR